jgi:hypothetical protein
VQYLHQQFVWERWSFLLLLLTGPADASKMADTTSIVGQLHCGTAQALGLLVFSLLSFISHLAVPVCWVSTVVVGIAHWREICDERLFTYVGEQMRRRCLGTHFRHLG